MGQTIHHVEFEFPIQISGTECMLLNTQIRLTLFLAMNQLNHPQPQAQTTRAFCSAWQRSISEASQNPSPLESKRHLVGLLTPLQPMRHQRT